MTPISLLILFWKHSQAILLPQKARNSVNSSIFVANNLSHFKFAKLKKHITVSKSPIKNEGLWDKYKK